MKQSDKFLLAIVASIFLLVGLAFALILLRPPQTYMTADTPEAASYNYLFALKQADYTRAHNYLSSGLKGRPASPEAFARDVDKNRWNFGYENSSSGWMVEPARTVGTGTFVAVRETHYSSGGIFGGGRYSNSFEVELMQEDGTWRIVGAGKYWLHCWERSGGCD